MANKIVDVIITDETMAITQTGFKSILAVDFEQDVSLAKVSDSTGMTGKLQALVDAVLGQTADELWVVGEDIVESGRSISEVMADHVGTDFYVLVSTVDTEQEIIELGNWVGTNEKLYLAQFASTVDVPEMTSLADTINSDRVVLYAHDKTSNSKLAGAVAGKCAPKDVGSLTWALQTLSGISKTGYSSGNISTMVAGNVNTYAEVLGTDVTFKGNTTSGSKIDITRSKDWLKARITENVTSALINRDKIPYTDSGISEITASISEVLEQGVRQLILEPNYEISAPLKAEIPTNDIANRVLSGINIVVQLAGAIESVSINVRVTL